MVIGAKSNLLSHQEQGNEGVAGHSSVVTALSIPRSAQVIKAPLSDGVSGLSGDSGSTLHQFLKTPPPPLPQPPPRESAKPPPPPPPLTQPRR